MCTRKIWRCVVGVDGSDGGTLALSWATREAYARGGAVHAVIAWQWSDTEARLLTGTTAEMVRHWSWQVLEDALMLARHEFPGVVLTGQTYQGDPADTLVSLGVEADLLVVGSHGHGRVGTPLGSVAGNCVHRATCPIVVVPTGKAFVLRVQSGGRLPGQLSLNSR